jgi:serine/threonine protein kinase
MRLDEIDRYCDDFERRLQAGESVPIEEFLQEHQLAADARLVAELEKLHREYRPGDGRDPPVNDAAVKPGTTDDFVVSEPAGSVIANYRLLQKIGEGGMGTVFLAEQQQPVRRKVALKLIKPGMDSREVIARFEAERQALAMMDHQHIAKVLDAGATNEGRPFFVMELVRGVSITK